ncbi:MAG: hypothetical protein RH862_18340 [Leptospiraceae bacterium]
MNPLIDPSTLQTPILQGLQLFGLPLRTYPNLSLAKANDALLSGFKEGTRKHGFSVQEFEESGD